MAFFLHKSFALLRLIYPEMIWRIPSVEPTIYLTFDDGPIPEVTEFVLEQLQQFEAQATFFCIGDNIRKHPHVFKQIIDQGHSVGNHTFNHLKGWKTEDQAYYENVAQCQELLPPTRLFRPPYGRIRKRQAAQLVNDHTLIMWDVLTGDYNPDLSPEQVYQGTIKACESGSIVVFHDSIKAWRNMSYALPKTLEYLRQQNFALKALPMHLS
ncbi:MULTISPECIES: polysaccharide deacetylase family protein [unclassified Siphonobacter]|uniref:polysaccharide deacetylase family protein n=1 Tax=unclassified Siphonobacter TaxID=2635712 RepID=UPI000CA77267|nr:MULTISPECIES: polysaccharide deacetylase family protein [unclassified Siphonobacter]MDQ1088792.1 peptidoglycan/xylan/chitin deacetylase (PgdA/CDA1 family) [Siphonobacter sp. SORGH_AS_1065]MDR6194976.1 peptidoglycan/xylan/chitin deacetylase (PgdA/CDA1 family) [Siphonobacter sp. SORGH_AS_0500]PKK38478.1 polysaccharide deacetylase family protein [Siphonobacter sp. SORGH_AS_0500]